MLETDFDKGARLQASRLHSFLKGIRVVDLSRYLPGPLASLMLSDLGAAVIKVESPQGDGLETLGPLRADVRSAWHEAINGGKEILRLDLKQAEDTLRKADALPRSKAEPRIRQNLALVVGLQGRFDEASALAREDLPPDQVEANMAYLKKMLSQPNTWQQISEGSKG